MSGTDEDLVSALQQDRANHSKKKQRRPSGIHRAAKPPVDAQQYKQGLDSLDLELEPGMAVEEAMTDGDENVVDLDPIDEFTPSARPAPKAAAKTTAAGHTPPQDMRPLRRQSTSQRARRPLPASPMQRFFGWLRGLFGGGTAS